VYLYIENKVNIYVGDLKWRQSMVAIPCMVYVVIILPGINQCTVIDIPLILEKPSHKSTRVPSIDVPFHIFKDLVNKS